MTLKYIKIKWSKLFYCVGLVVFSFFLAACSSSKSSEPYNEDLAKYLPQTQEVYYGDNQYYHEVTNVEQSESNHEYEVRLSGEIKNNYKGTNADDFTFTQSYKVEGNELWLTNTGQHLNDSLLVKACILKAPVEVGKTWSFKSQDLEGNKYTVDAEIITLSDDEVTVSYQIGKEDYEVRTIKYGCGTTEFEKHYQYKGAEGITGYHMDLNQTDMSEKEEISQNADPIDDMARFYDDLDSVTVSDSVRKLVVAFNQEWTRYSKDEDNHLLDLIVDDSSAYEKMKQIEHNKDSDMEFVSFKVINAQAVEKVYEIVEVYESQGQKFYNHVKYTLKAVEGDLRVDDFEIILNP